MPPSRITGIVELDPTLVSFTSLIDKMRDVWLREPSFHVRSTSQREEMVFAKSREKGNAAFFKSECPSCALWHF